jgi:hypothetical protein
MQAYQDLVRLAQICLAQSRIAVVPEVAEELRSIAEEYQKRADEVHDRRLAAIGDEEDPAGGSSENDRDRCRVVRSAKSWLCHHAADRSAPLLPWGIP